MNRKHIILICPDNDPEARTILQIADKAGISIVRSMEPHGGHLGDREVAAARQYLDASKKEVWVVELPEAEREKELRRVGFKVVIIDHHKYRNLDRLTDPTTGKPKPSSLEQFLKLAEISDEELTGWGFAPRVIHGIGIMDAEFAQGMRAHGYTQDEIKIIIALKQKLRRDIDPDYKIVQEAAEEDWQKRVEKDGYIIVNSGSGHGARSAISLITVREGVDTKPLIMSVRNGEKITVQNVDPPVVDKLQKNIKGTTFVFGNGKCWGIENRDQENFVTIDQILEVIRAKR